MPTHSEFAYNCDVYNQADLYVLDVILLLKLLTVNFGLR